MLEHVVALAVVELVTLLGDLNGTERIAELASRGVAHRVDDALERDLIERATNDVLDLQPERAVVSTKGFVTEQLVYGFTGFGGATDVELLLRVVRGDHAVEAKDRKSTRLNSSHHSISYAVFCLKKKKN